MGSNRVQTAQVHCSITRIFVLAAAVSSSGATQARSATDEPTGNRDENVAAACQWSQFHGPRRDNRSTETGLLLRWPDAGPRRLWTAPGIGYGYSSVNIATPVYQNGHLALFRTWGGGATKLRLDVTADGCTVQQVWHATELDNEHGGVVLVDGYLFGHADGNHKRRHWACLDWETGKTMYAVEGITGKRSGALTCADGMLYILSDEGTVALVPAKASGYRVVSRFRLPEGGEGPVWAHPVVCGERLYIRHGDRLYTYDIRRE